jgi:stage II sporulation protein M
LKIFCSDKSFNHGEPSGSWRLLFLRVQSLFLKAADALKGAVQRNWLIIKMTTLAFFIILTLTIIATLLVFYLAPEFSERLSSMVPSELGFEDAPLPFTGACFSYIFLNNSGHFWNPIRMLVWIPGLGPLLLGLEIMLNSGLIGAIAVLVGAKQGIAYPIIGLVPHGIIEIPAFLLQFAGIVLWQVTITEAIVAKLRGRKIERYKFNRGLKDVLILALTSVILLLIAAAIETYVTPYLLGL